MRQAIAVSGTLLAAVLLATAGSMRTQQQEAAPAAPATAAAQNKQDDASVALPAEALSYAAELEKHASPKLLDWAKKHARNLLSDEFTGDELSSERIARLFPAQPVATREAIRFLVGYEVYRRASSRQEARAAYLRDLDRDISDLETRQRLLEENRGPVGIAGGRRDAEIADGQRRREQMDIQRRLAVSSEEIERKRVDACLRWLAEAHPVVKDTPADILRAVPPPRS